MSELNRVLWRRAAKRHYEGWYITLVDPRSGRGFWFRYTVFVPSNPMQPGKASLWGFCFDPNDATWGRQFRDDFELGKFKDESKQQFRIAISDSFLAAKSAKGRAGEISWDLKLGPSKLKWQHFNPKLFELGVSQTCVASPALDMSISGKITVGDESIEITDAPGEQSHIWGRRPTPNYAWAHCNSFQNAPGAVFEGLSASLEKGPITLPPAGPILFVDGDVRLEVNGFFEMFGVTSSSGYGRWTFEARSQRHLLEGEVTVDPERVVAVEYEDPGSSDTCFCHNSIIADMNLELYQALGGRWEKSKSYASKGTTAFEITRKTPDPRVLRVLRSADGRRMS